MAKYAFRDVECSVCKLVKRSCVRLDAEEPIVCTDCTPLKIVAEQGQLLHVRLGWKPSVSKISGFGRSFDDFDKDYDRIMREGA